MIVLPRSLPRPDPSWWLNQHLEEVNPAAFFFLLDEERTAASFNQSQANPWACRPYVGGDASPVPQAIFEDEGLPPSTRQAQPWSPVSFLDDELNTALDSFFLEQEEPSLTPRQSNPWAAFVAADLSTDQPFLFLDQEEPSLTPVQSVPWACRVFADDELNTALDNFGLYDESFAPAASSNPWKSLAFADEDPGFAPPPPVTIGVQEEYLVPTPHTPWRLQPQAATYDEVSTSLRNFGLDDESPSPAGTPWAVRVVWGVTAGVADEPLLCPTYRVWYAVRSAAIGSGVL